MLHAFSPENTKGSFKNITWSELNHPSLSKRSSGSVGVNQHAFTPTRLSLLLQWATPWMASTRGGSRAADMCSISSSSSRASLGVWAYTHRSTRQDLGREHSILLCVIHMLCVSHVCHSVSRCVNCSSSILE